MNCKEFSEIADSYLSDELLVETNHDLIAHLEACGSCRNELSQRRHLRRRLQAAVRNSAPIDPAFEIKLRSAILRGKRPAQRRFLAPAFGFAGLSIAVFVGLAAYSQFWQSGSQEDAPVADRVYAVHAGLSDLLHEAAGNHKYCGIKFGKNPPREIASDAEYAALKAAYSGELELVEKHDCIFKGRKYSHTVLRQGEKLISILRAESDSESDPNKIFSVPMEQLQVAGFEADHKAVFIVSDLTEEENLKLARMISGRRSV